MFVVIAMVGVVAVVSASNKVISSQFEISEEVEDANEFPLTHWVMMALGETGGYCEEDKLEFATMSRKERRAAKRKRLKETTEGMTFVQKLQYFLYAYKMEILLPLIVIIAISLIVVAFFRGNKPIALSYAVVNCEDLEALDSSVIETDYWNYYGFDDNYQFQKVLDLKYDPSTSTNEVSKDAESGNYIAFPSLCDENYYDIIITNKRGLEKRSGREVSRNRRE